jgi:hypothetical protein
MISTLSPGRPITRFTANPPEEQHSHIHPLKPGVENKPSTKNIPPVAAEEKEPRIPLKVALFYPFIIKTPPGFSKVAYKTLALINWPNVMWAYLTQPRK